MFLGGATTLLLLTSADFPHARTNLGNMYVNLRRFDLAKKHYREAFGIDRLFYLAKVNLGMLYKSLGDNDKAEEMFREVGDHSMRFFLRS